MWTAGGVRAGKSVWVSRCDAASIVHPVELGAESGEMDRFDVAAAWVCGRGIGGIWTMDEWDSRTEGRDDATGGGGVFGVGNVILVGKELVSEGYGPKTDDVCALAEPELRG